MISPEFRDTSLEESSPNLPEPPREPANFPMRRSDSLKGSSMNEIGQLEKKALVEEKGKLNSPSTSLFPHPWRRRNQRLRRVQPQDPKRR